MGDVKRWSVTYTKHVKQKRKVYQDGFLHLLSSVSKVVLYDDSEKLLDSRLMKKDEMVKSGETLTFDAFLVDVGDPEGDHRPLSDLNMQGSNKYYVQKSGSLPGEECRSNPVSAEDCKTTAGKKKSLHSIRSPSMSRQAIREFKKNEMHKYRAIQSSPDTTRSSRREWQVLYTTHITQKAKKYHDGILRLAVCGSQGRQVMLYDANWNQLDSRFLKNDENVRTGELLVFDTHLVDIGEPEEDHTSVLTEIGTSELCKSRLPRNYLNGNKIATEWHALYTSQMSQKARKYHSGILKLAFCGSHQMKAVLVNEDGTTLSSRFLKLSEELTTGNTFILPNYLVELGEPCSGPEGLERVGDAQNNAYERKDVKPKISGSCFGMNKAKRIPTNKPLRDADGILSVLKKPMAPKSATILHSPLEEYEQVIKVKDEGRTAIHTHRTEISKSKDVEDVIGETVKLADSSLVEVQPNKSTFACFSLRPEAFNISEPKLNWQCINWSMMSPISSAEGPQVVDSVVSDSSKDVQPPTVAVPLDRLNADVDSRISFKVLASEAIASNSSSTQTNELDVEKSSEELKCQRKDDECPSFDLGLT